MIESNQSERVIKELSEVEVIEPVTPAFRRRRTAPLDILKRSPRSNNGFLTRVTLFDYGLGGDKERLLEDFQKAAKTARVAVREAGYSSRSLTFEVECQSAEQVETLSRIVGVRSIGPMPVLRTIRPRSLDVQAIPSQLPTAGGTAGDFPVVAVVATGISTVHQDLATWIVGRTSFVPEEYRNPAHGTFVAGLICFGGQLNPDLLDISTESCGVLDVEIIPNVDPEHGDIDKVTESEFLVSLNEALEQHANRVKVWNLSLGINEVCSLDEFSSFAQQLDELQEKYQVSFVLSAGNYIMPPLLDYPRTETQLQRGRITSPADSVLGITVGAISHIAYEANGPKKNQPSTFSRHGAGPNCIIKPDLVHYGGSCSTDKAQVSGIRSIVANGAGENFGTSFSTPIVSRALAQT